MKDKLQEILKDKFGLEAFRDRQEDIIKSVVEGNDTIVFMPTGGGKSLTYQLPGVYLDGVVLVISPLISLMKDQVDKLNSLGIRVELINSTIDTLDRQIILNDLSRPDTDIKFLYIAPERLNSDEFIRVFSRVKIALVAIDEAHCISQWGHDFRPSYMKIKGFLDGLRTSPQPSPLEERGQEHSVRKLELKSPGYIFDLAKEFRQKLTESEEKLWLLLKNNQFENIKFRRQHPIGRYIADFYSEEFKLIIELDGKIHDKNIQKEYDEERSNLLNSYGFNILRFKNDEILNNTQEYIFNLIKNSPLLQRRGGGGEVKFPIMALTATATKKVRKDIVDRLGLINHNIFTSGFDRKNISIIVREISKREEKMQKVAEILEKTPGVGIIYCSSRKSVKEVYDGLINNGIQAGIYTGAMNPENREREQNDFMNDKYKVIVATNAFGMGIDKKDIRFVIHYNLPGSIENYYQEVGRAGRDGKNSYGIVIASFGDTKIQEFFIENTYPTKQEILTVYDHLYKDIKEGEGKGLTVQKTYFTIAKESGINNDMKVGSTLRVLEKYGIVKRGVDSDLMDDDFRGRGLTLYQEKRKHNHLLIDWAHQDLLKEESYFKLEQIKKLLFYPSCRKRFILNYFGDEEDLATLPENCGSCDYCIEKKKFASSEVENYVNISVFALVLDVVKEMDSKIGVVMMTKFLWGSKDKKIQEWNLDRRENFGALSDLSSDLIQAVIEALISQDYLCKTDGKYPVLGITDAGKVAITRDYLLKDDNRELQHYIKMKLGSSAKATKKSSTFKTETKEKKEKGETYNETFRLFQEGKTVAEISEIRGLKLQTIENHLVSLYLSGTLGLNHIMKLIDFQNVKFIKNILKEHFSNGYEGLKEIREKCSEQGKEVSRVDINVAIAMIKKGDL